MSPVFVPRVLKWFRRPQVWRHPFIHGLATTRVDNDNNHGSVRMEPATEVSLMKKTISRRLRGEHGMTTAEYAVGTVASCGFAGVLIKLLDEPWVKDLLKALFKATIGAFF